MGAAAYIKNVRISPRKLGIVASLVRGRRVADAVTILEHTPRAAAKAVKKAVESAKANADYNHGYKPDSLHIQSIEVTAARRLTRYNPAAHGRALPYELKSSHIKVVVDGEKRQKVNDERRTKNEESKAKETK